MTLFIRQKIREDFSAEIGITGCNFAVAETGSVCLVTNEGNARHVPRCQKTHTIAVMGMERTAPTFAEVDVLITMLAGSAGCTSDGLQPSADRPTRGGINVDGPEEFHLVIVDNGRSQVLGSRVSRCAALHPLRACMNTCPAYRHVGGHGYGSIYPGLSARWFLRRSAAIKILRDLPYACSLCTACDSVCPVKDSAVKTDPASSPGDGRGGHNAESRATAIKMFAYANSHPGLRESRDDGRAHAASWFINGGKTPAQGWRDW